MREEKVPPFDNDKAAEAFYESCGSSDSYGSTLETLKAVDGQAGKLGLEVLLLDNGSSDYFFQIVPKGENTVLSLSPAHVLALRKLLSLDMGKIGVTENPFLYLLLKDALDKLGGYRGYSEEDDNVMEGHCRADPDLKEKFVDKDASTEYDDDE